MRKSGRILLFALTIVAISVASSCKSSKKKNKCNTCPTWDQVDIPEDISE